MRATTNFRSSGPSGQSDVSRLVRAALRRGLTIGCAVTIGVVPGTVIGYNIARQGAFPGDRYPLLVATELGTAKCCLDEVRPLAEA